MATAIRTPRQQALRRFRKNRLAVACVFVLAALLVGSSLLPVLSRYKIDQNDLKSNLRAPSGQHAFGTDATGRDLLTRTFGGLRITFTVGLISVLLSLIIGVMYGAISGYCGSWVDGAMMRFVDILYGLPTIAFVMLVVSIFRGYRDTWFSPENKHLWDVALIALVMGLISWLTIARIVRGQVLALKECEFVESARAVGVGHLRVIFVHIVPNLLGPVIVYATLTMPSVMLFESFLSFLGLGVQEPNVSLGMLLDDGIKRMAATRLNWWLIIFPGTLLAAVLFCLNVIGDGLRDAFDVRSTN